MYKLIEKSIDLGDGRSIVIETGKLAKQADGSVVVRMGRTMLLATVVAAKDAKEDTDFMPLSVEYKEKYAASGRFPGGFLKREKPGPVTMKYLFHVLSTGHCARSFLRTIMPKCLSQ